MFDILHVVCNGLITLLRTSKILAIDHDQSVGGRDICLLEGGPRNPRCTKVKRNCTIMGETDLIITLRSN